MYPQRSCPQGRPLKHHVCDKLGSLTKHSLRRGYVLSLASAFLASSEGLGRNHRLFPEDND